MHDELVFVVDTARCNLQEVARAIQSAMSGAHGGGRGVGRTTVAIMHRGTAAAGASDGDSQVWQEHGQSERAGAVTECIPLYE